MGAGGRAGRWAQARVAGVRTGAQGVLALGVGAGARVAGERQQRWGAQALGRAGERHGMGARSAGRCAAGRTGARAWAATTREERGGARQEQVGASGAAGWATCARLVCAAGPGWVFWCT